MGLTQCALAGSNKEEHPFRWYNHYQLHQFMQDVWDENGASGSINGRYVVLEEDHIYNLEDALNGDGLPDDAWGGDEEDNKTAESYRKQDREFVEWAKECDAKGIVVIYTGSA